MDGRTIRKWCVLGCLLAAVGCDRGTKQQALIGPNPDGEPAKLVNMPVGGGKSKSFWGGNNTPNTPTMPVEVAAETKKGPPAAETIVALADTQLEAAFSDRTAPGSKEELLDRARKAYQKALKQEPKSKAAMLGMARFYARVNEREQSVEMYKKYLTLYPKDAEVGHEVAMAHARWKDYAGAAAWCEYTLKNIDPENRAVKKTLGFCQAMAGQWDAAFNTLCQIMPEAQVRHNLAGLLDHMGQTEASKAQLQMALKADPNFTPSAGFLAELQKPREKNPIQAAGGSDQ